MIVQFAKQSTQSSNSTFFYNRLANLKCRLGTFELCYKLSEKLMNYFKTEVPDISLNDNRNYEQIYLVLDMKVNSENSVCHNTVS
jgi:hypothetical protein